MVCIFGILFKFAYNSEAKYGKYFYNLISLRIGKKNTIIKIQRCFIWLNIFSLPFKCGRRKTVYKVFLDRKGKYKYIMFVVCLRYAFMQSTFVYTWHEITPFWFMCTRMLLCFEFKNIANSKILPQIICSPSFNYFSFFIFLLEKSNL